MSKEKTKTLQEMYYDGYLKSVMDKFKKRIQENWDFLIAIDGREGAGKSMFAQQVGLYLDPTLSLDRIVFTGEEFMAAIKASQPYQVIIFDEAFGALSSGQAIKGFNRIIMKALREIRRKNLFIITVMPSFFDFTKYIALHRSIALLHVFVDDDYKRGGFSAYNFDRKNQLYIKGKEHYNYGVCKPNFYGKFCKGWAVDYNTYDKKKESSTDQAEEENISMRDAWNAREYAMTVLKESGMTDEQIAVKFKLSRRRVSQILKKNKEDKQNEKRNEEVQ